jgi:hypothetical protein|uniref:Uncharacterized protein n=1 Tax=viral metagenome TaxID=1070528 RepID=A0A6C0IWY5_9ZZZZ
MPMLKCLSPGQYVFLLIVVLGTAFAINIFSEFSLYEGVVKGLYLAALLLTLYFLYGVMFNPRCAYWLESDKDHIKRLLRLEERYSP